MENMQAPLLVLLLAANAWLYGAIFLPHQLSVEVLPVAKGDAILVTSPSGTRVLIDGGADASILRVLGETLPPWQRSFVAVIKTSSAASAAIGLSYVRDRYAIGQELGPADLRRGMKLDLGGGAYADVLAPDRDPRGLGASSGAVALNIRYGDTSFLIAPTLASSTRAWLMSLDTGTSAWEADVSLVGTTTPASAGYVSNGVEVRRVR